MADRATVAALSSEMADAVPAAPSVVQIMGAGADAWAAQARQQRVPLKRVVVTTVRTMERGERLRVRQHDSTWLEAELSGASV